MPKETIKGLGKNEKIVLSWGKGHFDTFQLGVDLGSKFKFVGDDEEYTGLWVNITDEDELDRLIWVLKRAKKQTFK